MKRMERLFLALALILLVSSPVNAHWVNKSGFEDYAQHMVGAPPQSDRTDGMPDFDQKQDNWMNSFNQWNWCGPVAVGNCLWWFDSKFETIKCKSLPPGTLVMPPAISDHYNLVHMMMSGLDDHDPNNVIPFITLLGNQVPGGIGAAGITPPQMKQMIENYFALPQVNLFGHYTVRIIWMPTFEQIYGEVEVSQDVIVLVGFYQTLPNGMWCRFGGHYMTVAGVDSQNTQKWISFSDPYRDNAEMGGAGVVHNGWLIPHIWPPAHMAHVHNDAGNVSHDVYPIFPSNSPGGIISTGDFESSDDISMWENFIGLNPGNVSNSCNYNPLLPVHTELEAMIVICPNFDYGDLHQDYPTIDIESCGPAHPLTDKAWLGESIDSEIQPRIYDLDQHDDGVHFYNLPWTPQDVESVAVTVRLGAHYAGEPLYLNAWKDGNIDGDFDDYLFDHMITCDEWIIQDVPVAAGLAVHRFCDPGPVMLGDWDPYDLRVRFRLTSQPVGRYGYGGYWGGGISNGLGTYDIDWVLGEVEDYDSTDMQLAVELQSFEAVSGNGYVNLEWITASESDIDYYGLLRREEAEWTEIARVNSQGESSVAQRYTFRDEAVENGCNYAYSLSSYDITGAIETLAYAEATPTDVILPTEYALLQNYPNPFNASTTIRYALPEAAHVTLTVYNIEGQEVATLVNAHQNAGEHSFVFDANDLASGLYLCAIKTPVYSTTMKMILIR